MKRIILLTILFIGFSIQTKSEELPKQSIYALIGYENEFGKGTENKHIKKVNLGASYERYLTAGLKIAPELRLGYNWQSDFNDVVMSVRGIAAYKIKSDKMAMRLPLTIFTGPRLDLYLRHEWYECIYAVPNPYVEPAPIPRNVSHNQYAIWWSFGIGFDIKKFTLRGSVNIPLRGAPNTLNEQKKYNSFEVSLGYRFALK